MSLFCREKQDQTCDDDGKVHEVKKNEDDFRESVENDRQRFLGDYKKSLNSFPVDEAHSQIESVEDVDKDDFGPLVPQIYFMLLGFPDIVMIYGKNDYREKYRN